MKRKMFGGGHHRELQGSSVSRTNVTFFKVGRNLKVIQSLKKRRKRENVASVSVSEIRQNLEKSFS